MKTLQETISEELVSERMTPKSLEQIFNEMVTNGIKSAWDEYGLEFTHKDIRDTLEKLAKEYDVDKCIDWAKTHIK